MIRARNERGAPEPGSREWCRNALRVSLSFSGNPSKGGESLGELIQLAIEGGLRPDSERLAAIDAAAPEED